MEQKEREQWPGGPSPVLRREFSGEENIYEEEAVMNQRPLRARSLSLSLSHPHTHTPTHPYTHLYSMVYENVCAQRGRDGVRVESDRVQKTELI